MGNHSDLKSTLLARVTSKVLADPEKPLTPKGLSRSDIDEWMPFIGNAPFHYQAERVHRNSLTSLVPWRMYKFDVSACRNLLSDLSANADAGKINNMLAACDAMILVTWTPDVSDDELNDRQIFSGTERNMEHIAGASAAVQNLLLMATEAGWRTYWSSGGILRTQQIFDRYHIPISEILLGAIFIFPRDIGDAEVKPGKLNDARGEIDDWSRWVE